MEIWNDALKVMREIRTDEQTFGFAELFVHAQGFKDAKNIGETLHTLGPRAELDWIQALTMDILSNQKSSLHSDYFLTCSIVLHSSLRTEILKEYIEAARTTDNGGL